MTPAWNATLTHNLGVVDDVVEHCRQTKRKLTCGLVKMAASMYLGLKPAN
eukprot:m.91800 g.91800  ORF g.91800 m.91800 type:complete len:50 (-) comp14916_c0_seq1:27-176(-)